MARSVPVVALALSLFALVGCDRVRAVCEGMGLCDSPPSPPVTLDVLCDFGGGSSGCTPDTLEAVLSSYAVVLPVGSVVRLHGMADSIGASRDVASLTFSPSPKANRRSMERHREEQRRVLVTSFLAASEPLFRVVDRRRSPIAENLARVILAGNPSGGVREIVVLTDARQVSTSPSLGKQDFECGPLPSVERWTSALRTLLSLESWRGLTIQFAYVQVEPVSDGRCTATLERYARTRELWLTSLRRLGVQASWSMGSPERSME